MPSHVVIFVFLIEQFAIPFLKEAFPILEKMHQTDPFDLAVLDRCIGVFSAVLFRLQIKYV